MLHIHCICQQIGPHHLQVLQGHSLSQLNVIALNSQVPILPSPRVGSGEILLGVRVRVLLDLLSIQIVAIIVVIGLGKMVGVVQFPNPSMSQVQKVT